MPDNDGYPTDEELKRIKEWKFDDGIKEFFEYAESLWKYEDRVRFYRGKDSLGHSVSKVYFSTGGWSGNESVIGEVTNNFIGNITSSMWKRGGHYWFELPKKSRKDKKR